MEEKTPPKLIVGKEDASQQLKSQIEKGEMHRDREINSETELQQAIEDCHNWSQNNKEHLSGLFDTPSIAKEYDAFSYYTPINLDTSKPIREKHKYNQFMINLEAYRVWVGCHIDHLTNICTQYGINDMQLDTSKRIFGDKIFIGHGHSPIWHELKDFISERLGLPCDEFNRVSTAGIGIQERLKEMLDRACMAFLIMTAEDKQPDGKMRARQNVIQEIGLFQGKLGFKKAIILLEEGCEEFSNIQGLGQIRFPKGNIKAAFQDIREVLEREEII